MNKITVNKSELLDALRQNRKEHRATFERALEGYRKEVIRLLENAIEDAKAGRRVQRHINIVEPIDQTSDYDRVIRMLQMSVDEKVELTEQQFAQYVMDDWSWKQQFTASTSQYIG